GASAGWTLPAVSVARTSTVTWPRRAGVHSYSQRVHASGPLPAVSVAADHVLWPSVLTSTRSIGPYPDHAKPKTACGPAPSVAPSLGQAMIDFTGISRMGRTVWPLESTKM